MTSRPVTGPHEVLLRSLAPELVAALDDLVDERVSRILDTRENGSAATWLTIAEAADYLRVSESTIARRLKEGRLASTYVGRRRLVRREHLDQSAGSQR